MRSSTRRVDVSLVTWPKESRKHRRDALPTFYRVTKSEMQPKYFHRANSRENSWRGMVTLRKRRQSGEQEGIVTMCKTRGQHVHTPWQKYVGTFPQKLWKAVGKTSERSLGVDNYMGFPTYPPYLSTYLSTQLLHLSHLFRPDLSPISTHTTITTTI